MNCWTSRKRQANNMTKLNEIQQHLKAPKNQFNAFGKYKYRSCEDILEAVKPLLGEATLVINDEIVAIGNRVYVKATATLKEAENEVSVSAYAREAEAKKGMDEAQITGATSSYARKYALNGLFLIDDTKDADTQDNTQVDVDKAIAKLDKATTVAELTTIYKALTKEEQNDKEVIAYAKVVKENIQGKIPIVK